MLLKFWIVSFIYNKDILIISSFKFTTWTVRIEYYFPFVVKLIELMVISVKY